ncbi:MAG: class IV adenylate cyclase [Bryobacteraceae bacterium]|jgi:adenylate cyclase class 2
MTSVETEVKLRWSTGPQAAQHILDQNGYRMIEPRTFEADQLFDRSDAELRSTGRLLRLRRSGGRATVTYKGPVAGGRYKSREEIEFDVSDADAFRQTLERLGYTGRFRYEKQRAKFARPDEPGIVTIDETPIGVFMELEGPAEWIDQTATRLGFSPSDYMTASYASLYGEYRKSNPDAPENMTFQVPGTP